MSKYTRSRFITIALCLCTLVVLFALIVGYQRCKASGGHYVRGLFTMECLR